MPVDELLGLSNTAPFLEMGPDSQNWVPVAGRGEAMGE